MGRLHWVLLTSNKKMETKRLVTKNFNIAINDFDAKKSGVLVFLNFCAKF